MRMVLGTVNYAALLCVMFGLMVGLTEAAITSKFLMAYITGKSIFFR